MPSSTRASVAADASRPKPLALTEPAKTSTSPVAPFSRSSQRLRVGGRRVGMIDPLHQRPGGARGAAGDGCARPRRGHKAARSSGRRRFCSQAVRNGAPLSALSTSRRHSLVGRGREIGGEGKGSAAVIECKMPCLAGQGQYGLAVQLPVPCASFMAAAASRCRLRRRASSASRTRMPPIIRSGAISASGTSTKARSNRRGCGSVRSGR